MMVWLELGRTKMEADYGKVVDEAERQGRQGRGPNPFIDDCGMYISRCHEYDDLHSLLTHLISRRDISMDTVSSKFYWLFCRSAEGASPHALFLHMYRIATYLGMLFND